jgi:hypothetical protein
MKKIKAGKVLAIMEEVVEEHGVDHVYRPPTGPHGTCQYLDTDDDNGPGCLIGHVLRRLGVPGALLRVRYNSESVNDVLRPVEGLSGVFSIPEIDLVFSESALKVMLTAQRAQDGKYTWGKALKEAKAVYKGHKPAPETW